MVATERTVVRKTSMRHATTCNGIFVGRWARHNVNCVECERLAVRYPSRAGIAVHCCHAMPMLVWTNTPSPAGWCIVLLKARCSAARARRRDSKACVGKNMQASLYVLKREASGVGKKKNAFVIRVGNVRIIRITVISMLHCYMPHLKWMALERARQAIAKEINTSAIRVGNHRIIRITVTSMLHCYM